MQKLSPNNLIGTLLLAGCLIPACSGCATPLYELPAGYSSTYKKAMPRASETMPMPPKDAGDTSQ